MRLSSWAFLCLTQQAPGKTVEAEIHTLKAGELQIGFASIESIQAIPLSADPVNNVR